MNFYQSKQLYRRLALNKFNNLIKVFGLMLALVPTLLIVTFVRYELSYDSQYQDYEKVYRIIRNWQEDEKYGAYTPVPFLSTLMTTFPEIETGSRLWPMYDVEFSINDRIYNEAILLTADSSFVQTFELDLIYGNRDQVLRQPQSLILSSSIAKRLFGNSNPVGERIKFSGYYFPDDKKNYTIAGVYQDFPKNSHLKGNFILPINDFRVSKNLNHNNHSLMTYVKLTNSDFKGVLEQKLPAFMKEFYGKEYYDYARSTFLLQPISDIHLNTNVSYNGYETAPGSYSSVYIFPALSFLIVLIAVFNFINLTMSESKFRKTSFGIHKLSGASRFYFFKYFAFETTVLSGIGAISSIIVISLISPAFKSFIERDLTLNLMNNIYWVIIILGFIVFLAIVNGLYAILTNSSKSIVTYFKPAQTKRTKKIGVQNSLQIVQFAICIFFITGSILVYKQLNFVNNTVNEGLEKENILVINNAKKLENSRTVLKSEFVKLNEISKASLCDEIPGYGFYSHFGYPVDSALVNLHVAAYYCDHDYLSTLKMQMVDGRFFNLNHSTDNDAIVLNETAVKGLGWEKNAIGKKYKLGGIKTVIGVVKDIHFESFHEKILPQGFVLEDGNQCSHMLIKAENGFNTELLEKMEAMWSVFSPNHQMDYSFLNEGFDFWYKTERKTGKVAVMLAIIAIFLSVLGLLALVLQSINSHIKEIGIRKVNGAKTFEIMTLLNIVFIRMVIIASIIIIPISVWVLNKWLENFAYKTSINVWMFLISVPSTLIVALLTVSWHTYRAARRNPVEALRYE